MVVVVVGVVVAAVGLCDAGEMGCASFTSQDCGGGDERASMVPQVSVDAEFGAKGSEEALPGWG